VEGRLSQMTHSLICETDFVLTFWTHFVIDYMIEGIFTAIRIHA